MNKQETFKNAEIKPDDCTLLATVLVRFTYKDKFGVMGEDTVEISKRDSELAIATFEKKHPKIVWREFSFV